VTDRAGELAGIGGVVEHALAGMTTLIMLAKAMDSAS